MFSLELKEERGYFQAKGDLISVDVLSDADVPVMIERRQPTCQPGLLKSRQIIPITSHLWPCKQAKDEPTVVDIR